MSLEALLKEKIYSKKKDRMKCDVTIRTCVTTIHRDQRYLHLVADRSYRNTSTTLTTTPFQNIQHLCQCKISKAWNWIYCSLKFSFIIGGVGVVKLLRYRLNAIEFKYSRSIDILHRSNARSLPLFPYIVFSFFFFCIFLCYNPNNVSTDTRLSDPFFFSYLDL